MGAEAGHSLRPATATPRTPVRTRGRNPLLAQWQVLSALVRRESESRHGRRFNFGFALGMLEPLIIIGAICLLFWLINHPPIYGSSMVLFVATGVFPVYLFIHTAGKVHEPLQSAHLGRYTLELPIDNVVAHATLHALSSAAVAIAFFCILYFIGERQASPYEPGRALAALLMIYALGVGMGLFNAVLGRVLPIWGLAWPALSRASVHFSAIYYVVDSLPPRIRGWFALNPILHAVNWFRTAFYPFYPTLTLNPGYLGWCVLATLTVGLCLERRFRPLLQSGA
ncbi:MAG: ABC transporter permease [Nevskia sp.]|nr:ABC transporter permease [Nevskia sp.]